MALQVQRVQSPLPHASRREAPLGAASSGPRCSSAVVAVPGVLLLQGAPLVGSSAPLSTRQASPVGHPKCSSSVFAFRSARSRLARARLRPPTLRSSCAPSVRRDAGSAAACLRLRGFRLRRPLCQVRKRSDPFRVRIQLRPCLPVSPQRSLRGCSSVAPPMPPAVPVSVGWEPAVRSAVPRPRARRALLLRGAASRAAAAARPVQPAPARRKALP